MDLQAFAERLTAAERADFCARLDTSSAYLSQLISGHRRPSPEYARRLVKVSKEMFPSKRRRWLTLPRLRPDVWGGRAA